MYSFAGIPNPLGITDTKNGRRLYKPELSSAPLPENPITAKECDVWPPVNGGKHALHLVHLFEIAINQILRSQCHDGVRIGRLGRNMPVVAMPTLIVQIPSATQICSLHTRTSTGRILRLMSNLSTLEKVQSILFAKLYSKNKFQMLHSLMLCICSLSLFLS
jgi:hypothetical protein